MQSLKSFLYSLVRLFQNLHSKEIFSRWYHLPRKASEPTLLKRVVHMVLPYFHHAKLQILPKILSLGSEKNRLFQKRYSQGVYYKPLRKVWNPTEFDLHHPKRNDQSIVSNEGP